MASSTDGYCDIHNGWTWNWPRICIWNTQSVHRMFHTIRLPSPIIYLVVSSRDAYSVIRISYQLSIRMLIDKPFSRVLVTIQLLIRQPSYQPTIDNEVCLINWNLTSEIHLTLTVWKPIPYIFPIRTTVHIGRGKKDRILANLEN